MQQRSWPKTGRLTAAMVMATTTLAMAATDQQTGSQQLKPIVVEGQSEDQREDLKPDSLANLYRVEASARFGTEVFTEQDIKNLHPDNVFDLIDKAAGVNLVYQGRRSPFMVEERGGGTFTYIIDGAILPPSSNRILYKFPVAAIEEMQIVRGSTALTLGPSIPIGASNSGSGLNTGFIIIRTKQPKKTEGTLTASAEKAIGGHPIETNESAYVGTRFGEDNQGDKSAQKGQTGQADGASGSGSSASQPPGTAEGTDSPKAGPGPVSGYVAGLVSKMDRPSQDTWFDGRDAQGGLGSAGLRFGKFDINMMAYKDSGSLEMQRGITTAGVLQNDRWWYDPLETTIYSTDMAMHWTPNQITLFNAFKTLYDQEEHNGTFTSSVTTIREYSEESSGFGLRHNARFGNTLLQAGWQMASSNGYGPNLSSAYNRFDTTINGWSGSVEQKLFDGRLVLDGGYRQDTKHIDNASTQAKANAANNDVDLDPAQIYALGSRLQLTDMLAVSGRYYNGDQGTGGDFEMRPLPKTGALEPERQERIEVGLEANIRPWLQPSLTWFDINADNVKTASTTTYVANGATYYYYTQSDELRRGIELMLKGTIARNTTYKCTWTHMLDGETTSNGITTDALGATTPQNLYGLTVSHTWAPYRFNLSVKQVDKWTTTNASGPGIVTSVDGIGDYTRIDANVQRDIQLGDTLLTATLFGRNLSDDNYASRYVTGYYQDRGRTIGLELSWSF